MVVVSGSVVPAARETLYNPVPFTMSPGKLRVSFQDLSFSFRSAVISPTAATSLLSLFVKASSRLSHSTSPQFSPPSLSWSRQAVPFYFYSPHNGIENYCLYEPSKLVARYPLANECSARGAWRALHRPTANLCPSSIAIDQYGSSFQHLLVSSTTWKRMRLFPSVLLLPELWQWHRLHDCRQKIN